jgi:hypothetical protein
MSIPGTAYQLVILLVLVLPGVVYSAMARHIRGRMPEDQDVGSLVLRSMMVSAALDSAYLIAFGPRLITLARSADPAKYAREAGLWALLLLFVVPSIVAFVFEGFDWRPEGRRLPKLKQLGYHPTPTAWDYAAPRHGDCFVRIRLSDGKFVGGWIGKSFVSTYPEPRDIYIGSQWYIDQDNGRFLGRIPATRGLYVALSNVELIEWMDSAEELPEDVGRTL